MRINGDKLDEAYEIAEGNLEENDVVYKLLDRMYNDFLMKDAIQEDDFNRLKKILKENIHKKVMYVDEYQHIYDILFTGDTAKVKDEAKDEANDVADVLNKIADEIDEDSPDELKDLGNEASMLAADLVDLGLNDSTQSLLDELAQKFWDYGEEIYAEQIWDATY